MPAAIFDVDRTLLDGMSGYFFSAWLWKNKFMPHRGRLRTGLSIMLYRAGIAPETEMVKVGVTALAWMTAAEVARLAERCVDEVIWPKVFAEAQAKIAEHNAAGDFTALASGSALPVIEALARKVGAQAAVGTSARTTRAGVYLPIAAQPLCYREGKEELVRRALDARGLRLEDAYLYSDNGPDIPLLTRVAHPFAVNPDAELLAKAKSENWPVLSWSTPVSGTQSTGTRWPLR